MAGEKESTRKTLDADDVIEVLGFGPAQAVTFAFVVVALCVNNMDTCTFVFTARNTNYRCRISECDSEQPTYNTSWLTEALPLIGGKLTQCERYASTNLSSETDALSCLAESFNSSNAYKCDEWVNEEESTIITEFNIQCQDWKRALIGTLNGVGQLICLTYFGYLADKLGARTMMTFATLACVFIHLVQSFVNGYWVFLFLELLSPSLAAGGYGAAYVLGVEMLTPKKRVLGTTIMCFLSALAAPFVGIVAWLVPYWRYVLRICYAPALVFILCPILCMESFRWLILKGKSKKIFRLMQRSEQWTCKKEKCEKTTALFDAIAKMETDLKKTEKPIFEMPIREALKSRKLCIRIAICACCWISCTLVGFGMSLNAVSLSGNEHLNFILTMLVDLPSLGVYLCILNSFGRKYSQFTAFACCAIMCIVYAIVPLDQPVISLMIYLCAKFFISLAFYLIYIYTAEMFPTNMRNSCLMFCSMIGRVGTILAPQTAVIAERSPSLLLSGYALVASLAALMTLLLPETRSKHLPDTVDEATNINHINTNNDDDRNKAGGNGEFEVDRKTCIAMTSVNANP